MDKKILEIYENLLEKKELLKGVEIKYFKTFNMVTLVENRKGGKTINIELDELEEEFTIRDYSIEKINSDGNNEGTITLRTKDDKEIVKTILKSTFRKEKDYFAEIMHSVREIYALKIPIRNSPGNFHYEILGGKKDLIQIHTVDGRLPYGDYNGALYPIVRIVQCDFGCKGQYKTMKELPADERILIDSCKREAR